MKNRLMLLGVVAVLALGLTAPAFGGSNAVSSSAVSAKSTASKALAKANKAFNKAKKANKKAKAAQAAADGAQAAADAAQATADSKYGSVQYTSGSPSASNQTDKTEFLFCSGGKKSVGGGYAVSGADNAAYVFFNAPYGNDGWVVGATDDTGVNSNWALTLYLNCIGN